MRALRVRRVATAVVLFSILTGLGGCWYQRECPTCPRATPPPPELTLIPPCGSGFGSVDRAFTDFSSDLAPNMLFLSGGGSYGAWGAGVLYGWAETQARPPFRLITGSSTGALLGVFAILGGPTLGEMDEKMKAVYTTSTDADIFRKRFLLSIPFSNSATTLDPLRKLVRRTFTPEQVRRVGEIYEKEGRQLWIGTTNLDTGQFCNWNMSEIALQGDYDKFIELLVASCANPGIFDPQLIDGSLHADGGVRHQIYGQIVEKGLDAYGLAYQASKKAHQMSPVWLTTPTAYGVVNGAIQVRRQCVTNEIVPVVLRSSAILMNDALEGDLFNAEELIERYNEKFPPAVKWRLMTTRVPEDYALWPSADVFQPADMLALFELGRAAGKDMSHWEKGVPRLGVSPAPCLPP
jgi:hypothetical protein